jgi:hypothetical protein
MHDCGHIDLRQGHSRIAHDERTGDRITSFNWPPERDVALPFASNMIDIANQNGPKLFYKLQQ